MLQILQFKAGDLLASRYPATDIYHPLLRHNYLSHAPLIFDYMSLSILLIAILNTCCCCMMALPGHIIGKLPDIGSLHHVLESRERILLPLNVHEGNYDAV